jgi:hypothetical protein
MMTMLRLRKPLLLLTCILLTNVVRSQVTQEWIARFATSLTSTDERAASMTIDGEGNVYVTGSAIGTGTSFDYTTIKYNTAGVLQWVNRYNGPANGYDRAIAITVGRDGNVYVTGESPGNGTASDYATIKINNSTGATVWASRYNGPCNGFDAAVAIAVDEEGNVYVTGQSKGDGTDVDYATIKLNNINGAIQWVTRYNGPANAVDRVLAMAIGNDNVYVTGYSAGDGTGADYATIKHNKVTGAIEWVSRFNGAGNGNDAATSVTVDHDGNVYVTGTTLSAFTNENGPYEYLTKFDFGTVKYNAAGLQQWVAVHDEVGYDFAVSVKLDNQGNVYVTGSVSNSRPEEQEDRDFATIKYTSAGVELWEAKYGPPPFNEFTAQDQALDSEGNVYVTGHSGQGFTTVRFNNDGTLQWAVSYRDGVLQYSAGIEVDASGNVYISGSSSREGCFNCIDFATIKYSQLQTACGKTGDKVLVCHKGKQTLCINAGDVAAHMHHGDQLGACAVAATRTITARESQADNTIPANFKVFVAPNPAASTTKISYALPFEGRVSIAVYDMLGRMITTLADATKPAGFHYADVDVTAIQPGMYTYRIVVKTAKTIWTKTGKISVIK